MGVVGTSGRRDDGFATLWAVTAMAVVAVAAGAAIWYGAAILSRHRAADAADAVALTAALHAVDGAGVACRTGAALGRLDGANVTQCEVQGAVATVTVAVPLPGPLAGFGTAIGRARAGPASEAVSFSPSTRR